MTTQKKTFCRICEPFCPMIATVDDDGKVTKLAPNPDHPSGGTACHKGLSFFELHNDPDRLDYPLKRVNPKSEPEAQFERIDWDTALTEAGSKLRAVLDEYGPNAIATYIGNPIAGNSRLGAMSARFGRALGSKMRFSATSQDMANKVVGAIGIYGSECMMVPDLENTDYLLAIGGNPAVSKWTIVSVPNSSGQIMADIKQRGGKICFVNPRKIESSNASTGETLLIKPGADVYFLAAVLWEVYQQKGFDQDVIEQHGHNVDLLIEFIKHYPAETVANVTGIEPAAVKQVAAHVISAKSAAIYVSTGVNQSRQGVLTYWLSEMLSFVTGNLGKKGGSFKPTAYINQYQASKLNGDKLQTSLGDIAFPSLPGLTVTPGVMLADLINSGDIKALVNLTGNPVMSIGDELGLREAVKKLDVMVSIDIQRNATAEVSDYVFAGTDFLERADINHFNVGYQLIPYTQYTDAVATPKAERKEDWWILARLMQTMGLKSPPSDGDGFDDLNKLLGFSELSIDQLKQAPEHTVLLKPNTPEDVYDKCIKHEHGKVDCYPIEFERSGLMSRCHAIFKELAAESDHVLKLISMRTPYMHNSWLSNLPKLRMGELSQNPLNISPADANRLGLISGDVVKAFNDYGSIETRILVNEELRQGTVAMSHGYGRGRKGMTIAEAFGGANCNQLMPTGPDSYEPISHMSWLCAVPVQIEKLPTSQTA